MQIRSDQLIVHNINKCHTVLFRKQIKGNDFQWRETTFRYLVWYPSFGQNYSLRCPLTACITYSCYGWLRNLTLPCDFSGWKLSVFLKTQDFCSFLSYAPWCRMPFAAFSVKHVCLFKYRTCETEIGQIRIYTSRGEKLERKKALINHKIAQNSHCITIYSQSWEKKTHLDCEKALKSDILFLNWNSDNHGQKSWEKFALLVLLRMCQTWILLHPPNLAPHPPCNVENY